MWGGEGGDRNIWTAGKAIPRILRVFCLIYSRMVEESYLRPDIFSWDLRPKQPMEGNEERLEQEVSMWKAGQITHLGDAVSTSLSKESRMQTSIQLV